MFGKPFEEHNKLKAITKIACEAFASRLIIEASTQKKLFAKQRRIKPFADDTKILDATLSHTFPSSHTLSEMNF